MLALTSWNPGAHHPGLNHHVEPSPFPQVASSAGSSSLALDDDGFMQCLQQGVWGGDGCKETRILAHGRCMGHCLVYYFVVVVAVLILVPLISSGGATMPKTQSRSSFQAALFFFNLILPP
jgi:hypothetical protein